MSNEFCLYIAGLNIFVESVEFPIILQSDLAYAPFISLTAKDSCDIHIKVRNSPLPSVSGMKKLFDNSESWSLLTDGESYYMLFQPPIFNKPYLIAKTGYDFRNITIFCSDFLIEETEGSRSIFNPVHYPLDQMMLMHYLALRKGAIIHAAGASVNEKGIIFCGRSGAGKSTISRLCSGDGRFEFLSDDRIIARKASDGIQIYGTPWPGDEGIAINDRTRLSGIFFIFHGTGNRVEAISSQKAFEMLMPITSIPWYEEDSMSKMLFFCEELTTLIPAYKLFFRADKDIQAFLHDFISGLKS